MSRTKLFRIAAVVLSIYLWVLSGSTQGGILPVLKYSIAGTLSGLGLIWIGRAFASLPVTARSFITSLLFGLFICTPAIAQLLGPDSDRSNASVVVLAMTAAAAAAMGGALWGVATLAGDALGKWRHHRSTGPLSLGGAHR